VCPDKPYFMGTKCPHKEGNIENPKTAYKSYKVMFFFWKFKMQKVFFAGLGIGLVYGDRVYKFVQYTNHYV